MCNHARCITSRPLTQRSFEPSSLPHSLAADQAPRSARPPLVGPDEHPSVLWGPWRVRLSTHRLKGGLPAIVPPAHSRVGRAVIRLLARCAHFTCVPTYLVLYHPSVQPGPAEAGFRCRFNSDVEPASHRCRYMRARTNCMWVPIASSTYIWTLVTIRGCQPLLVHLSSP